VGADAGKEGATEVGIGKEPTDAGDLGADAGNAGAADAGKEGAADAGTDGVGKEDPRADMGDFIEEKREGVADLGAVDTADAEGTGKGVVTLAED
jgi:hypothetical protein